MTNQNYLIIENNVVTNLVVWDGNVNPWTPPEDSIQLVASEIPAKVWELDYELTPMVYVLKECMGAGSTGFTWNGSVLTTNELQPPMPQGQFEGTTGTTTL